MYLRSSTGRGTRDIRREQMECLTCINSILDKLHEFLGCKHDFRKDDHGLFKLKVELRLVKTFLLCSWKLGYDRSDILDSVHQNGKQLYPLLARLEDGLPPSDLALAASRFHEILKDFRLHISKAYVNMFESLLESVSESRVRWNTRAFEVRHDWSPSWRSRESYYSKLDRLLKSSSPRRGEILESSSPLRDEFMEFFNSLVENHADILIWGEACDPVLEKLLEPLQEKLVFLKNFTLFARLLGKPRQELMEHCGKVALSAAHLSYVCWYFRDDNQVFDGIDRKISDLIDEIKPIVDQVRFAYIGALESEASSIAPSTKMDMSIVGNFGDSLLGNLWEFLSNYPTWFAVSLKHQIKIFYEGLRFLRNILLKQQEEYDGLPERIKDLITAVVNDAGIVIFSLYQKDIREASAEEIDLKLFCLLGKIKLIKTEVEQKYPVALKFEFPTTNALGLIDLLLEKLKVLASCETDLVSSFAKDRVDFLRSYLKKTVEHPTRYPAQEALKVYKFSWEDDMEQHNQHEERQPKRMQEDLLFLRSFLENNLEQHLQNEKLQFQRMRDDLESLRSFLERYGEQRSQHEQLQALWILVMGVTYEAEFVIESLIVGDISLYSLMLFDDMAQEINRVKSLAQEATNSLKTVTSQATSKSSGASHNEPSQGTISKINKAEVALKDQEQAIIDKLIRGPEHLDMISIVGMAGLGKTFLAQRVYHDPSVKSHFHTQAWCCVSQTYCKKDLLLEILACIDPKAQYSEMNQDDLAHKLCRYLSGNKYLIVLDDVWDIEAWNALKISFPDHTNGSRILLTSRYDGISGSAHRLRPLDVEESWELLKKKLSITIKDGHPIDALGRQIAKNCNGLPLSIVIMSGILETLDQGRWEEVAERLDANSKIGATEQCKSILELSYIHLPDNLKPCLLYFSAFREDQEISVKRLMRLWIAEGFVQEKALESVKNLSEGFVQKKEPGSVEKLAEGYLKALINRSLVMEGQQRSIGEAKTCHIHDLLHVFCLGKVKDQNFLQLVRGYDGFLNFDEPNYLRRLSIHSQPKHFVKSRIFYPHLRSLLHSSHGVGSRVVSYNLSFVCLLKLLQVLDLEQISLGFTFPCELGLLIQLRYLAVSGWIKYIPPSLENLSNLESFLVTTYYSDVGLSSLQDIFWKLQKLRHLQVRGALIDLRLPRDSLESSCILSNLHTFSTPKLYLGQSMEKMMMKFPNIHRLKCCLLQSEQSSSGGTRIVAMDSLSQLESLKLLLGKVTTSRIEFHLPLNLKKLTLEDSSWSIICTIRKLPNLEVLKLIRQTDGEEEWDMGDMEDMEEEEFFPKLKFLKLESLKMVKWMGSGGHFPSLERLILYDCVDLEELPSCLPETLTLQLIEVHGCLYSAGEFVRDIKKQQMDYGNKDLKIVISEEIEESSSWSGGDSDGWSG